MAMMTIIKNAYRSEIGWKSEMSLPADMNTKGGHSETIEKLRGVNH